MFGLFKGINDKRLKFAVGAYLNPAFKKATERALGRNLDMIESSQIRDEAVKCIEYTYSIEAKYVDGSDNRGRPQSHFIAMLCLLNSLTKTSFPEDGFLKEVTMSALGILGYEFENNIVKLDNPNSKDKAIYTQCVNYINNREKTSAEKEIEEYILNNEFDAEIESQNDINKELSVEQYLEKYININTNISLMHGNTRQIYIIWLIASEEFILNGVLKNNHSYIQAIYCIVGIIFNERNNNKSDSKIFILSFLTEIKLTMLRDGKEMCFTSADDDDKFSEVYDVSIDEMKLLDVNENLNYDEWFDVLKNEAVNHHNQLFISDEGISYFDLIDNKNFKLAYEHNINPKILAKEVANNLGDDFSIVEDMVKKGFN
jgi:hypothetical protein